MPLGDDDLHVEVGGERSHPALLEPGAETADLDVPETLQALIGARMDGLPPDVSRCAPDYYDLDLRAEIWQYTPGTGAWTGSQLEL